MTTATETAIEADPKLPIIRITREFAATSGQLFRAHTDPALFARWVGPDAADTRIEHWDARTGGSWRYIATVRGTEHAFRGCFHEVRPDRRQAPAGPLAKRMAGWPRLSTGRLTGWGVRA